MSTFKNAPISGIYITMRSIFKILRADQTLCKYLYYPSIDMEDDPDLKNDLSNDEKNEVIIISSGVDDLEGTDKTKRGRLFFGLGPIKKSFKNHMASRPTVLIYIFIPRVGFQNVDFRLEAVIERLNDLISNNSFEGSFGRIIKDDGNSIDAPKGYIGYVLRYEFSDMDS